jgi:hypothetical protein
LYGTRVVVEVGPELRGIDARVFDLGERQVVRMDVVHREQAGNAHAPRRRGNQTGHPVVAVDQVRLNVGMMLLMTSRENARASFGFSFCELL